jgi:hypothetical protein
MCGPYCEQHGTEVTPAEEEFARGNSTSFAKLPRSLIEVINEFVIDGASFTPKLAKTKAREGKLLVPVALL